MTTRTSIHRNCRSAYSLVEVVVSAVLLALVLAGAAAMALIVVGQEEANARIARTLNLQEQAARLFQLGLAPATISSILPPDPAVVSLTFSEPAVVAVAGVGNMETSTLTLVFTPSPSATVDSSGTWTAGDSTETRQNEIFVARPTTR